ncbi:MAG: sugar phosphate isomerase/epimerase [Fibrobacteria bacterium]|nr:sugar phosphate isomerase/epimerase [Fibrobacteria bacterium]
MKIGMNMFLWTTEVTHEHFSLLEEIKKTGYDGIEVPVFDPNVAHYKTLDKELKSNGLQSTVVTVIPDQEHSPVSDNPKFRKGAVEYLKRVVDCCEVINADVLCGPFYQVLGSKTGKGSTSKEVEHAIEVFQKVADYAKEANVTMAVEALNRFECYFLNITDHAAAFARYVDRENFGILYDTFHANIEEKDPIEAINNNSDMIKHIHISANDRGTPGYGNIPWIETFNALRSFDYDGWCTVEAFGLNMPEFAASTCIWRPVSKSNKEAYTEGYKLIAEEWENAGKIENMECVK